MYSFLIPQKICITRNHGDFFNFAPYSVCQKARSQPNLHRNLNLYLRSQFNWKGIPKTLNWLAFGAKRISALQFGKISACFDNVIGLDNCVHYSFFLSFRGWNQWGNMGCVYRKGEKISNLSALEAWRNVILWMMFFKIKAWPSSSNFRWKKGLSAL